MRERGFLNRFAVFFFAFLLFFTLFSGSLRSKTTPKVMYMRVKERMFPVTVGLEDGGQYVSSKRELGVFQSALHFLEENSLEDDSFSDNSFEDDAFSDNSFSGHSLEENSRKGNGKTIAYTFVLKQTEDGYVVRECLVELGETADGWYEVKAGLGKGDLVVCAMDRELSDGMRVEVWEEGQDGK